MATVTYVEHRAGGWPVPLARAAQAAGWARPPESQARLLSTPTRTPSWLSQRSLSTCVRPSRAKRWRATCGRQVCKEVGRKSVRCHACHMHMQCTCTRTCTTATCCDCYSHDCPPRAGPRAGSSLVRVSVRVRVRVKPIPNPDQVRDLRSRPCGTSRPRGPRRMRARGAPT